MLMITFPEYLAEIRAHVALLQKISESSPEFQNWEFCHSSGDAGGLVQMFPIPVLRNRAEKSAAIIARAFGGMWSRRNDGGWECETHGFRVILHNVYKPLAKGNEIDLSDPSLSPASSPAAV